MRPARDEKVLAATGRQLGEMCSAIGDIGRHGENTVYVNLVFISTDVYGLCRVSAVQMVSHFTNRFNTFTCIFFIHTYLLFFYSMCGFQTIHN